MENRLPSSDAFSASRSEPSLATTRSSTFLYLKNMLLHVLLRRVTWTGKGIFLVSRILRPRVFFAKAFKSRSWIKHQMSSLPVACQKSGLFSCNFEEPSQIHPGVFYMGIEPVFFFGTQCYYQFIILAYHA